MTAPFTPASLLNGAPAEDAAALRALAQVNYGHFTSLQVRGSAAQGLDLHFARLAEGSAALFDAAFDTLAVRGWMRQAARAAGGDGSMRVTVFARDFDHRRPLQPVRTDVLVTVAGLPPAPRPLRVQLRPFLRPVPELKHVGTFPLLHHRREALKAGYDDALFVDGEGEQARVAEGSVWNIGFWDGNQVVWPQAPALRGTTERLLQAGLQAAGVGQVVRPVRVAELAGFRAAFAANANGLQPILAIGTVQYAPGAHAHLDGLLQAALRHAAWEPL
ncbi:aminotransferase class IV [Pseudoxanthomonas sp. 10H]|uniref:aminotransferase class IV n=1 Tax=Pseudoxanthomonas sp. 10H TaxID=3242729 RepID=UPI00355901F5